MTIENYDRKSLFERLFNSKLFKYFTLLLILLMATILLFVPFYASKSFQIDVPKGINYAIIFVYGYLVVKIINSFFENTSPSLNDFSEKGNGTYSDVMHSEVERKVYRDFLETLHNS